MVGEKRLWKLDQGLCVLLMLLIPSSCVSALPTCFTG